MKIHCYCAVFAECGALLGFVGDLRSPAVLDIRLLGQTKIQLAEIASIS